MSIHRTIIINYFLVHRIEVENLILLSIHILSLTKYPWHNPESKEHRINNKIDAYHHVNLKYRTFIHHGFKEIYKLCQLLFS